MFPDTVCAQTCVGLTGTEIAAEHSSFIGFVINDFGAIFPFTRIRSLKSFKCGDVNKPVL